MMRKIFWYFLFVVIVLYLGGCAASVEPVLKGTYQTTEEIDGYPKGTIVMSFQPDEESFVQYISSREVNKGTYEEIKNNVYNKTFKLKGDMQNLEIELTEKNTFEIVINKMNNGKRIQLTQVDDVPVYFSNEFDDVDEYKALLKED
ncbi:hypothetical protein BN1058_02728 [Paraliobacillus sp. PM-2]|uniref:hypothetical protein n=1 Tax=Paraliobacillus sp. PM-2 TaxID=1462524 RepID=UPI00061BEB79|nr:hypothetical protein [Paraliobacillus sp. PM-2]CQR48360.1 hypothetical protein BN1058_02728 [Paraliobacillus sp. PM-2]